MRQVFEEAMDNVENNIDLTNRTIAFNSLIAMELGAINFIFRGLGMNPNAANILTGAIGGLQGLAIFSKILGQQENQNNRAKWVKNALLATTTALVAIAASMLMESVVNITKNTAREFEPYPPVNLSPYIAAAIGGATFITTIMIGKSIINDRRMPLSNEIANSAISGGLMFATVPGVMKAISAFAKDVVKEPIKAINESLIENIGENCLFQAPLGAAACGVLGFSLSGMMAIGYFAAEGANKAIKRLRATERNNNAMAGVSELLVRHMLGMNLRNFERLPLHVLENIMEYAFHADVPQPYPVDMTKLNPYANALKAVTGIRFIRHEERLAEHAAAKLTQARTEYNLLEEGNLARRSSDEQIIPNFLKKVQRNKLNSAGYELTNTEEGKTHERRSITSRSNANAIAYI